MTFDELQAKATKKHNCKVKFLAFRNGDHLSVDLWFHPKEEKGREDL
ncbi:hypothetical protein [Candidatus Methanodesulfokora washburnensis]|nr:hypothetical protein [Candidatus Methanodesulfokores washburnensis]